MVVKLIEEINKCLDIDCYLTALISALSLPDICGKAEYPTDKPAERYKKWYEEYIGKYEADDITRENNIPYPSGEVVYSLRNSLVHAGSPDINETTCDIQEFDLLMQSKDTFNIYVGSAGVKTDGYGNVTRSLCINIRQLCYKLCVCAEHYYKNNKDKFGFINSKLTYWSPQARQFLKRKREDFES